MYLVPSDDVHTNQSYFAVVGPMIPHDTVPEAATRDRVVQFASAQRGCCSTRTSFTEAALQIVIHRINLALVV